MIHAHRSKATCRSLTVPLIHVSASTRNVSTEKEIQFLDIIFTMNFSAVSSVTLRNSFGVNDNGLYEETNISIEHMNKWSSISCIPHITIS